MRFILICNLSVRGPTFSTLCAIFHEQQLTRGNGPVRGHEIRPQALSSISLCTVEGEHDNITGAQQTHAAHALCRGIAGHRHLGLTISNCDSLRAIHGAAMARGNSSRRDALLARPMKHD
jgi:poly-beta-hydroxyalkanoate depolymerase